MDVKGPGTQKVHRAFLYYGVCNMIKIEIYKYVVNTFALLLDKDELEIN